MAWKVEIDRAAVRDLSRLDRQAARRILAFLHDRVAALGDPRSIGEALRGSRLGEFWKYRIGAYRVIARIEDAALGFHSLRDLLRRLSPSRIAQRIGDSDATPYAPNLFHPAGADCCGTGGRGVAG